MAKKHEPKNKKFALAVVVLIAVALLFLSGCGYTMTPNNLSPATVPPPTVSATLMPLTEAST